MVEHQPSKLNTWVRFPSPAFFISIVDIELKVALFLWGGALMEENMNYEEMKQVTIDKYIDLMRIKAEQKELNKELERQIKFTELKLSTYAINLEEIKSMF